MDRDQGNVPMRQQDSVSRRKKTRACDQCRKRKVRCDGTEGLGTACSTCLSLRDKCTYTPTNTMHKTRQIDEDYLNALESEVTRLRFLVQQLQAKLSALTPSSTSTTPAASNLPHAMSPDVSDAAGATATQEGEVNQSLLEGFTFMSINEKPVYFMGRSSHFPIVQAAIRMKQELQNGETPSGASDEALPFPSRRPQFWSSISDYIEPEPPYVGFPDPDLMNEVLGCYFATIHDGFPVLHRPTFLQSIASGLHLVDEGFGAVLLLVCALGARFSQNPATLPAGATTWQFAGWQWFEQVRERRKLIALSTTTLYDVQVAMLGAAYVATLGIPHTNFALAGHGLRLAQDLGAHRRMAYGTTPTVEGELRKRAFWCLLAMDRGICTLLGRSPNIQDNDFDVDFPTECDDEYWVSDDPQKAFKQPHGKPSVVSHFIWYLKLNRIHSRALRMIYSLEGSKNLQDPERARQVVADLDSDLNQWEDALPPYLKYDSNREDAPFAAQAACLSAAFHNLRMFIHRPFITMSHTAPLPFPSLTICTNAARSFIQALDRYSVLAGPVLIYHYHVGALFAAAAVLLLRAWQGIRSGTGFDATMDLDHVKRAMCVLKSYELHWTIAGRFWDILSDLVNTVESRQRQENTASQIGEQSSPIDNTLTYTVERSQGPSSNLSPTYPDSQDAPDRGSTSSGDMDLDALFAELLPNIQWHYPPTDIPSQGLFGGPFSSYDASGEGARAQHDIDVAQYPFGWDPGAL